MARSSDAAAPFEGKSAEKKTMRRICTASTKVSEFLASLPQDVQDNLAAMDLHLNKVSPSSTRQTRIWPGRPTTSGGSTWRKA